MASHLELNYTIKKYSCTLCTHFPTVMLFDINTFVTTPFVHNCCCGSKHSLKNWTGQGTGEATSSLVPWSDHQFIWLDGDKNPLFLVKI
jgi:hypothetical protein